MICQSTYGVINKCKYDSINGKLLIYRWNNWVSMNGYFNFIYPIQLDDVAGNTTGLNLHYGTPDNDFLAKIQDLPGYPTTFKNSTAVDFVKDVQVNNPAFDHYYPVNHQINGVEYPQMEYLRFFTGANETTIQQPKATNVELQFSDLFKIPLLNVKYALINKRASDYGIVPGKF